MSIKKAAFINMIAKYSNVFIGLIFSAIIARLLTPHDYGIVAVVNVFTTFFMLFSDMGIGSAIVQNKSLTQNDNNSIFSFSFVLGFLLAIIFSICAFPISFFYASKHYLFICPLLSISLFFNTINMVPNALLLKKKKFVLVAARTVIITVLTYGITIILALVGLKFYALVLQSVLQAIFNFIWNNYKSGLKLAKIEKSSLMKVRNFSLFQFAFDFMNYFARNLDNLLMGHFMGQKKLGYYDKGYRMMLYPINNLTFIISPVLHPILSDYQDNKEYIYIQYKKVVKILSIIGVYIATVSFFSSREIILIMFGNQWVPSIDCFKLLSISVWSQMVGTTAGAIFKSLGRTDLTFKSGLIHIFITITMIIIGISTGSIYILAGLVAVSLLVRFFVEYYFLIKKGFKKSLLKFIAIFVPELVGGILLSVVLYKVDYLRINNLFFSLVIKAFIAGVIYLIYLYLTKQIKYIWMIIPNRIKNKKRR